jgi:hypothetical protein
MNCTYLPKGQETQTIQKQRLIRGSRWGRDAGYAGGAAAASNDPGTYNVRRLHTADEAGDSQGSSFHHISIKARNRVKIKWNKVVASYLRFFKAIWI